MRFFNSTEYLNILVEFKLLERQSTYYSAELQYCNTSILQYRRTALDFSFLVSLELQVLDITFFIRKGSPFLAWEKALGRWGIPLKSKKFVRGDPY